MDIGVPKEIKSQEYRVSLLPDSIRELVNLGHQVFVETQAGLGIQCSDEDYQNCGAKIVQSASELYASSQLIIKVKEPQSSEIKLIQEKHILFTFLHLAPDLEQAKGLLNTGCTAIAYETVTNDQGGLPLLAPMSEVAGRLSVQEGAHCLQRPVCGGRGVLMAGVPGVSPAKVVIIGGGVVGQNAVAIAVGMGAQVTVLDRSIEVLRKLDHRFGNEITTVYSNQMAVEEYILGADLVIGSVLIPGAKAPKLVSEHLVKSMLPGAVIVDVAIDQGGCVETSKPTTYANPIFNRHEVVHFCVANMPGGVPRTASYALSNATLPYVIQIAELGWQNACRQNIHLGRGLNICQGKVYHPAVAEALNLPLYTEL